MPFRTLHAKNEAIYEENTQEVFALSIDEILVYGIKRGKLTLLIMLHAKIKQEAFQGTDHSEQLLPLALHAQFGSTASMG